jgi:hypothetical protein
MSAGIDAKIYGIHSASVARIERGGEKKPRANAGLFSEAAGVTS